SERIEQRVDVMAIHDDGMPAKSTPAARELIHVVLPHRRAALAECIDVDHAAEVVQFVDRGEIGRLPDRSFSRFAITEKNVGAIVGSDSTRVESNSDCGAAALAERSCGHVDEWQAGCWVPFEVGADRTQFLQLASIDRAGFRPRGIEYGCGMPF